MLQCNVKAHNLWNIYSNSLGMFQGLCLVVAMTIAEVPRDFAGLRALIAARAQNLPKRLAQVAVYALERPDEIALGTAASIAEAVQVQPSTLVRFAQSLGFSGFTELMDKAINIRSDCRMGRIVLYPFRHIFLAPVQIADKAVPRVAPLLHQLQNPVPVFAIGVEAGDQHIEAVLVHGIIDRHACVAAHQLFHR